LEKVFWFFFSKKNYLLSDVPPPFGEGLFSPVARCCAMRVTLCVLVGMGLGGCQPAPVVGLAAGAAASVAVFGRTPVDMAVSLAKGRDCSVVRLDRGERYCKPAEAPPVAGPFCTRTLGQAECFADPDALPDRPAPLADGPVGLTAAQEKDRTARWGL